MIREKEFIKNISPCDVNIYNRALKAKEDVYRLGPVDCPNKLKCEGQHVACTMRFGTDVARYSLDSSLDAELKEIKESGLIERNNWINSKDRLEFETINGRKEPEKVLYELKRVAEELLA